MAHSDDFITRRGLLGRVVPAAALVATLDSVNQATAQTAEAPPRIRDSFDFGWKFFKGDAARRRSSRASPMPPGAASTCRTTGASKGRSRKASQAAAPAATRPPASAGIANIFACRRRYQDRKVSVEFDGVYQNSEVWINGNYLGKRPYRLHQLRLRPHPAPERRRR